MQLLKLRAKHFALLSLLISTQRFSPNILVMDEEDAVPKSDSDKAPQAADSRGRTEVQLL